jgi:hypothetical protein
MTATALQFSPRRSYLGGSVTRLFLNLVDGFREAQEISHRYEQLSHLSDAELAALKMRREDLPRIAVTGVSPTHTGIGARRVAAAPK